MKYSWLLLLIPLNLFSQCPNFQCADAIPIGCEPTAFENYDCPSWINVPVLQHPVVSTVFCGGTYQFLPQWWTFDVPEFGYYDFNVGGLFQSTAGSGNYGAFEGIMWKLAKGNCDDLEWIAASQCPTWPPQCFCSSPGWVGMCGISPCSPVIPLIQFWYDLGLYPTGSWLPYDPTQQNWDMVFPLTAGRYYILTTAFTGTGNGETWPHSFGEGEISICHLNPLSSAPVLVAEGLTLTWDVVSDFATVQFAANDWVDVATVQGNEFNCTENGIYRVVVNGAASNYVRVNVVKSGESIIYGIDGKENTKFGILKTR